MRFIVRMLTSGAVIFGVAYISAGSLIRVDSFEAALVTAVVLAIANAVVKPIVSVLSLPITILTLGLFSLVINALMLYLAAWVVPGFHTVGFWQTVAAALLISVVTAVLTRLIEGDER